MVYGGFSFQQYGLIGYEIGVSLADLLEIFFFADSRVGKPINQRVQCEMGFRAIVHGFMRHLNRHKTWTNSCRIVDFIEMKNWGYHWIVMEYSRGYTG